MQNTTRVSVVALLLAAAACSVNGGEEVGRSDVAALNATGIFKGLAGKCLDSGAGTRGTQTRLWDCNGSAAQEWTINDAGEIKTPDGKCLDVTGASSANGTAVMVWDCNGGANQKWTIDSKTVRGFGGKCLDVSRGDSTNGTPIIIWSCHGGTNQQWAFQASSTSSGGTTTTTSDAGTTTSTGSTSTGTTAPTSRDVLKWPFASNSIWNMPIGTGAVYQPANLPDVPANGTDPWTGMPQIDDEHIVLKPTAPLTNINISTVAWSGGNRCAATGGLLMQVPIPTDFIVPNDNTNAGASFLLADGRTIVQTQPFARCTAGQPGTSLYKFPAVDIYGDGRTGAHGGSGLSAIGGSLRVGELRPGGQGPRHALKVDVYGKGELAYCSTASACYRWPANNGDGYAVGFYGTVGNPSPYMKMGALLAIPANVSLDSLGFETQPAKMLAWTLQNYGAYIVDDAYGPSFYFSAENGADGSFQTQFKNDWGFPIQQLASSGTPWVRDVIRIRRALRVVDNNSPTSIGGGGTPLQPLAPAL